MNAKRKPNQNSIFELFQFDFRLNIYKALKHEHLKNVLFKKNCKSLKKI